MRVPEIERDLRNHVDKRVIYHMQRMQEEISDLRQQLTTAAKVLEATVDALNQLRDVNLQLNAKWRKQITRDPSSDGLIKSVLNKPDEIN